MGELMEIFHRGVTCSYLYFRRSQKQQWAGQISAASLEAREGKAGGGN